MDITQSGEVKVEQRGNEPEVLGYAVALGGAISDTMKGYGIDLPGSIEAATAVMVSTVLAPLSNPEIGNFALRRFGAAEVNTSLKDIDRADMDDLLFGLKVMGAYGQVNFRQRLLLANKAGANGRAAFLDYAGQAGIYLKQLQKYYLSTVEPEELAS